MARTWRNGPKRQIKQIIFWRTEATSTSGLSPILQKEVRSDVEGQGSLAKEEKASSSEKKEGGRKPKWNRRGSRDFCPVGSKLDGHMRCRQVWD
ncbi:hypothetical protein RUM43_005452 [Polyplax serrata]|uniref:Uncharacterized protein n=1 Tax=Polyplax serrata TaxID=468196 RepID=A0AAN8PWV9_POLSC